MHDLAEIAAFRGVGGCVVGSVAGEEDALGGGEVFRVEVGGALGVV